MKKMMIRQMGIALALVMAVVAVPALHRVRMMMSV